MTAHPLLRIILSIDPDDDGNDDDYNVIAADISIGVPLREVCSHEVMGALAALVRGGLHAHLADMWGEPRPDPADLPAVTDVDDRGEFTAAALQAVGEVLQSAGILPGNAHIVGLVKMGSNDN